MCRIDNIRTRYIESLQFKNLPPLTLLLQRILNNAWPPDRADGCRLTSILELVDGTYLPSVLFDQFSSVQDSKQKMHVDKTVPGKVLRSRR